MRPFVVKTAVLVLVANFGFTWQCALAARFVDLGGVWSERYINTLSDKGVINAEPDGKFRPDQPVTRAVFAYWLVKVLGLENQPVSSTPSFKDVKPTDWCYKPIEIIRQNNFITGYSDGFRPNQLIQRAEVINILARTLNAPTPSEQAITQALSQYSDKSKVPAWAKVGVAQATLAGVVIGPEPHTLNPMTMSTRGDTAAMLCALHQVLTHQDIKDQTDSATAQIPSSYSNAPQSGGGYPQQQAMMPQSGGGYPQQGMMPQGYGVQPQQFSGDTDQYQGRVQAQQQAAYQQQAQGYQPQGQYMQGQQGMMPPGYPQNGGVQGGYPQQTAMMPSNNNGWQQPMQGQTGSNLSQSPWQTGSSSPPLQGSVTTVAKGTKFEARIKTSLDSATAEPGEIIEATISTPIYSNGNEVIPAGSKLIGQVTDVVSAKRFKFGANGKIELKFTQVQTPDGRKFPLTASVDKKRVKLQGGSTAGRVGKSLMWTGIGAGGGALLGTAFGAMAQNPYALATGHPVMRSAMIGGTLGGTAGLVGAAVRKGSEVKISPGTEIPIQLDEELQVSGSGSMQ
jgi:hypothetical protein